MLGTILVRWGNEVLRNLHFPRILRVGEIFDSHHPLSLMVRNAASVLEASNAVLHEYEQPADQSAAAEKKRAAYGQGIYDEYSDAMPTPTPRLRAKFPYQVRVKIPDLYIRKGAGVNYPKGNCTGKGVFTIVEEADGQISSTGKIGKWGLLNAYQKNRGGWICLSLGASMTEKV